MKPFHYHNTEKRVHNGKHVTRKVVIKGGKGYKSVTEKRGRKRRTAKLPLKLSEVEQIKKGNFIRGLFREFIPEKI
jgi:hypothetical protein